MGEGYGVDEDDEGIGVRVGEESIVLARSTRFILFLSPLLSRSFASSDTISPFFCVVPPALGSLSCTESVSLSQAASASRLILHGLYQLCSARPQHKHVNR